jgi:hypothetical protein
MKRDGVNRNNNFYGGRRNVEFDAEGWVFIAYSCKRGGAAAEY